ncbi:hypothetical protein M9M90_09610 [Phenylobacterium sp. LH3H17]|uniref:hypothetical protein n=1 Tax=Phenylobacterium sp. LH3H17 TaxID=2903901 RepID=UPI0020C9A010|nr:hypothetical protein [Phenylobacterium sp. LH3H17]UTP41408.1 hypothetical protein M9M90_09610 [Phenylobacterium sp. LH3H17]
MEPWNRNASPQASATFIEEVLNQLAELAALKGYRALASTLMMAALDAARAAAGPPDQAIDRASDKTRDKASDH